MKSALSIARTLVEPGKVGLTTDECFFLDFFRTEGALDAYGPPYDILFLRVVRQLGTWQPTVKHAALALTARGNTFSRFYWDRFGGSKVERRDDFVLRQTNKSITHLLRQPVPEGLTGRRAHRELVMTTCLVLAFLAYCHNDFATLQMHVTYGQRAMLEWEDANFDNSSIGRALFDGVSNMDFRLRALSNPASFLQDDNPLLLHAAWDLTNFNVSYVERSVARYWDLWSQIMFPRIPNGFSVGTVDDSQSILRTWRVCVMLNGRVWERQLKTYVQLAGQMVPQSLHDLLTSLRMWEQSMCAWISAAVAADEDPVWSPLQMKYDVLGAYFRRINELGKKLLRSQIIQGVSNPAFPIDQAVATPLFFCGMHCRDWSIRREALDLMKAWGERFPSTTSSLPMALSALEHIIDVESHGLQPGSVVPEAARIHFAQVTGSPGSSNIGFSYLQLGQSRVDEI